ncbi:MAG: Asp-tRNA(Asn)/Glu-tRNA(Gln) amidotransferase subunit GatC [Parcubacteria group bacterium]|nr:Asp-tRNA(Asn)/Glu-tRNA(Gln) amidotransferase subunit GatC [Parcubacteria group bacterium]
MDQKELKHLAELARIRISDEKLEALRGDCDVILKYVSQIKGVEGGAQTMEDLGLVHNVMREDGEPHESGIYSEELLREAPEREGQFVKVKKIL